MKIGLIISKSSYGGGERMQQMLIHELIRIGHEIIVFTWEDSNLNEFNNSLRKIILKRKLGKIQQFIYEVFQINIAIRSLNIECLIVFGTRESFILSSFFSRTITITALRVDPRFPKNNLLLKLRNLFSLSFSTGVVFQTEKVQKYFSKKIQAKSIVIPNPIIDESLSNPKLLRKNKIVSVGRLSSEKNYPLLIDAFSNINQEKYTLHIYGEGKLQSELEELILKNGMKEKIFLEGQVDKIVDEISDAEIFIMSSDYEGMPNALIEAMAMGLACICTNFPSGAAEFLISNLENGILIPVGDQKQLKKSIELLINDKILCDKLKVNAVRVRNTLNKKIIIDQWSNYIDQIKT